jgi:hypothetical protein
MKVKFSKKEIDFLKNTFPLGKNDFNFFIITDESIELNKNLANKIRDWAGEKQQMIGYDENYELTEDGKILESIIDKLYC